MPLTLMELDSVTVDAVNLDGAGLSNTITPSLPLESIFIFASDHHVISIKQRPRDRLLKILSNGVHDDNKEKFEKHRTLVCPNRDGELHGGSSCGLDSTLWTKVENSHPLYELFRNFMKSQGVPNYFTRHAVKGILKVEEGDMHWLLFLAMLLYQVVDVVLPGLEGYTPAQIFWITYGYSWCMKQSGDSLIKQLLTNPHAPSSCRTNQVVQDIPAFASDFNCKVGQKMYPKPEERTLLFDFKLQAKLFSLFSRKCVAVLSAVALAISSLVLNIIILTRVNNLSNDNNDVNVTIPTIPTQAPPPAASNNTMYCPNIGPINNATAWKDASSSLLNGLDQSIDPCVDFYAFTCNKFLANVDLNALGKSRLGTYDVAQTTVNSFIADVLKGVDVNDDKNWSLTERITKARRRAEYVAQRALGDSEEVPKTSVNAFGDLEDVPKTSSARRDH
ncbi:unnamed protein product [Heligmosomoides polygyrus]|uniref:Peptidase_M13 domain-containing protein n=1 Tax=Heligmosomoides polygyrus TaxID=6339 RepID=A0A3P8B1C5_HELPZ|nr:unnamed protein product [Heligmosomoides polygyrus]